MTAPKIADLVFAARALAGATFKGACDNAKDKPSTCLRAESERPLSRAERERYMGSTRRGFALYDHTRMCRSCAAYWLSERAAQLLEEKAHIEAVDAAVVDP